MRVIDGLGVSIPSNWDVTSLSEVTSKIGSGATPRGGAAVYINDGPALIRSQNVHDSVFRDEGLVYLSDQAADALKGVSVYEGDVLINITGDSILRTCLVPKRVLPARVNQHVAIVRSNGRVDPGFLQKWLSQPLMKDFMLGHSSGGTRKAITKGHLQGFPIPVPPIDEQRGIAAALGALDDKIQSNRRAAGLIEELLMLEFHRVISSNGVSEAPLTDYVATTKGVSYKSIDLQPSRTALVTLKSVDRAGGYKADGLKPYIGPYKPRQVLQPGELVVAQTDLTQGAEVVGRAVRVPADTSVDTLVASLDLVIVRPLGDMPVEYLQGILTDEAFRQYCRSRASGTTVLHLASDAIPTYNAPIVSHSAQKNYSEFARPLINRIDSLSREIGKLTAARDGLLPSLLSGRIRVPEAGVTLA